jgi:hypothetical protein
MHPIFGVDPPVGELEALIAQLMQEEPRILAIEGGHNLLLRVVGGRKAAEAFLYSILCTRQRHLWLLTCRSSPWSDMDRHVHVSRYFSQVISVDPLSEDSVREALQLRLEKCGLQASYRRSKEDAEKDEAPDALPMPCRADRAAV